MKQAEFLQKLFAALEPLSAGEREQIREYVEEMFCDAMEQGLSEEECAAQFGSPEQAAREFREGAAQREEERQNGLAVAGRELASRPERKEGGKSLFRPDHPCTALKLDVHNFSLHVSPWDGPELHILFEVNEEEDEIRSERRGDVWVFTCFRKRRGWRMFGALFGSRTRKMEIFVPHTFRGRLSLSTTNARVAMEGCEALSSLLLKTTNASVSLQHCSGGELCCRSSNGALHVEDVHGDTLQAVTSNARVELTSCVWQGACGVHTSNGSISASQVEAGSLSLQSSNARIHVEQVRASGITLATSNGSIGGTVVGDPEEYTITTSTSNASCSPKTRAIPGAQKALSASTSNGSVALQFVS